MLTTPAKSIRRARGAVTPGLSAKSRHFGWVVIIALVALLPYLVSSDITLPLGFPTKAWLPVFDLALIAMIGAASFDLLVAYTGQLSFAHAAFLMLGTSVGGLLGVKHNVSLVYLLAASLIIGAAFGAIVGLPALRLRGLYLALATLAVFFFFLRGYQIFQRDEFGFGGILFPAPVVSFGPSAKNLGITIDSDIRWYWLLVVVTFLSLWFMRNLISSRIGRGFAAVRHHDLNAALLGVNVVRVKLTAFAVSSAFVTMNGTLLSYYVSARDGTSYSIQDTLNYAAIVVVGGLSRTSGVVLGALFFYSVPVLSNWALTKLPFSSSLSYLKDNQGAVQLGFFGAAIVVVLVFFPEGLIGLVGRLGALLRTPFTRLRSGLARPEPRSVESVAK